MADFDSTTWLALGLTLTLVGLVASVLLWRRRGAASGLRGAAWSVLPLAAALTGTLRLAWEVADAVVDWALRLVLSPVVWAGICLAVVSGVLFVVSGLLRRRSGRRGQDHPRGPRSPDGPDDSDDLDDIEAILKRHGIS